MIYITCDVLDKNGTLCPNADNSVTLHGRGRNDYRHGQRSRRECGEALRQHARRVQREVPLCGEARRRIRNDEDYGDSERLDGGNNQRDEGGNHYRGNRPCSVFCGRDEPRRRRDTSEPTEPAPTISAISTDKTTAALNEEITFTMTVKNTTSIRVYIDGSVNRYIYDVTDGTMTYKLSFTDAGSGTRTVAFEPCRGDVVGAKTAETVITLAANS